MDPFSLLEIDPTSDKIAIRRAYVQAAKKHHPDSGGDPDRFQKIQYAYELLINNRYTPRVIKTKIKLQLHELLRGCVATAVIGLNKKRAQFIEFTVPANTIPGTKIEFFDQSAGNNKISVTVDVDRSDEYVLLNEHVVFQKKINKMEALQGTEIEIINFDKRTHTIEIPPNTTAKKLTYEIQDAGFIDTKHKKRGNLIIVVEVT